MSISKIIHYCWFGRNEKPKLALKCIKSWKKYCPDYKIIEWNEDNFVISECPLYVRQAYEAKKWAFVTDYVRLKVVHDYGGIYLDTDVELCKTLDGLLEYKAYFGFENEKYIATGLGFGAPKDMPILKELLDDYENVPFILADGTYDLTPCPTRNTKVFLKHGLIQNNKKQIIDNEIVIFPSAVLCPIDCSTGIKKIRKDTISIHHFSASWYTKEQQKYYKERRKFERKDYYIHFPNRVLIKLLGMERYERLKAWLKA